MKKWSILAVLVVAAFALSACASNKRVYKADPTITKSKVPTAEPQMIPPGQARASVEALETGKRKWRVGDTKNAIKAFNRAIEKNPYNFEAHYWLGLVNRDKKKWDDAAGHFTWAVKYCPQGRWEAKIRVDWGTMYELQGQPGMAAKQYDLALLADPDYREAQYGRDRVLPLPSADRGHGKAKHNNGRGNKGKGNDKD